MHLILQLSTKSKFTYRQKDSALNVKAESFLLISNYLLDYPYQKALKAVTNFSPLLFSK